MILQLFALEGVLEANFPCCLCWLKRREEETGWEGEITQGEMAESGQLPNPTHLKFLARNQVVQKTRGLT